MIKERFAIFDMDGTLVDSMPYWNMVCDECLRQYGLSADGLMEELIPLTIEQTAEFFKERLGLDVSVQQITQKIRDIMRVHYEQDVPPKDGALAFLQALKTANVQMCVASSTPVDLIALCLQKVGMADYFKFLISSEDVGKGKTEPDIYLEAARRLGAEPSETIVFEDALLAAETAKKAGFTVTGIYDECSDDEWAAFRETADYAFDNWGKAKDTLL